MQFKIIEKDTGKVRSNKRMSINLHTGCIYDKGTNVTHLYRLELEDATYPDRIKNSAYLNSAEDLDKIMGCITKFMKGLKGGELKALIVIYDRTVLSRKPHAILSNQDFKGFGDHLTRRDYIIKATDSLVKKGLIRKEDSSLYQFKYTPIFKEVAQNGNLKK